MSKLNEVLSTDQEVIVRKHEIIEYDQLDGSKGELCKVWFTARGNTKDNVTRLFPAEDAFLYQQGDRMPGVIRKVDCPVRKITPETGEPYSNGGKQTIVLFDGESLRDSLAGAGFKSKELNAFAMGSSIPKVETPAVEEAPVAEVAATTLAD